MAAIDEMTIEDAKTNGVEHPDGTPVKGKTGLQGFSQALLLGVLHIHIKVEDTLKEGNKTMARCVVTGTHTGPGLGMPATGKQVQFTAMCLARLEDGKPVEAWNNFDLAMMFRRLH